MNDESSAQDHIEELVAEEHRLLEGHRARGLSDSDHARLAQIKIELDRYWDLLRQRRAHEEFGLDPEQTSIRDAGTVEGYEG